MKEIVSVVRGKWKDEPSVYVILPTADRDYDVYKELRSDRHLALYFDREGPLTSGGLWSRSIGPQTFVIFRNHVAKVATELGFHVESESKNECTFVRYRSV